MVGYCAILTSRFCIDERRAATVRLVEALFSLALPLALALASWCLGRSPTYLLTLDCGTYLRRWYSKPSFLDTQTDRQAGR